MAMSVNTNPGAMIALQSLSKTNTMLWRPRLFERVVREVTAKWRLQKL